MIKPEFFEDSKLGRLELEARYLYIGLWTVADDVGNVSVEPGFIKGRIFPYDDLASIDAIEKWIAQLADAGRLEPYEASGERYAHIPKFLNHQTINKPSAWRNPPPESGEPGEAESGEPGW